MSEKRTALIVINTYKTESSRLAGDIRNFLAEEGIESRSFFFSGDDSSELSRTESPFEDCSFAVTLGGDGTVLFAARGCAPRRIPVFPVNLGEFGFIAGVQIGEWKEKLACFLRGELAVTNRSMIRCSVVRGEKTAGRYTALNDIVVSSTATAKLIQMEISFDRNSFGNYKADGIVVATPTGSTAYSAAAGGPIVDPGLEAFVLSPICAFSLSNRPVVLPSSGVLTIRIDASRGIQTMLTADGQVQVELAENDIVRIERAEHGVLLAGCDSRMFYTALRSKLNWSGGPRA